MGGVRILKRNGFFEAPRATLCRVQTERRSQSETRELARAPSDEVTELVRSGLLVVERIARRMSRALGARLELEELLSAGREGLFDAARRFDRKRGLPFVPYATLRIRGAMLDSARRMAGLPRRAYERALASCSLRELGDALRAHSRLHARAEEEEQRARGDDPEAALERAQLFSLIHEALSALTKDEAELIQRHYFEGERVREIGKSLGITAPWAGRILARAVARLSRQVQRRVRAPRAHLLR